MSQNQPKRHGALLTLWLILLVISNAFVAIGYIIIAYLLSTQSSAFNDPTNPIYGFDIPLWAVILSSILSIVNLGSVIALFKWRKWGFFVFCASTLVAVIESIALGSGAFALEGFLAIAILYLLLHSKWNLLQ
jgi:hypothetical protein